MNRSVLIPASLREMAADTVRSHVGEDAYSSIKQRDEHPQFLGLLLAYEGESTGSVEVDGRQQLNNLKRWTPEAVEELAARLNLGQSIPLVEGHQSLRVALGHMLSGFTEENAEGETEAFAIGYVQDQEARARINDGTLDCCSVEAEVTLLKEEGQQVVVASVGRVDAVALGNRQEQKPGFERAGIQAVVNELEEEDEFLRGNPLPQKPQGFLGENPLTRS